MRAGSLVTALALVALLACVSEVPLQAGAGGQITVAPEFERGLVGRWLLGDNWRDLWTEPIELRELDLAAVGGGLRPVKQVGALQTLGLAFAAADGGSYTFRTVRKRLDRSLPDWLRWGPQQALFRDQGSATLPAAPLVVSKLMRDQGILVPLHELVVMPDDPRLGEFRERFAGSVGMLARYPLPGENGAPGDFGALEILSSEELWRRWEAGGSDAVDVRAYLRARLVDWWVGDWDRHPQQWRWARILGRAGWQPLPEDHDQAFADYDGAVATAIRPLRPQLVEFEDELPMRGLRKKAAALDAWLLVGLDAAQWSAELDALRARSDAARLDAAISSLPVAWRASAGRVLRERLGVRLEGLSEAAFDVYRALARQPHWHGSNARDRLVIACHADGSVDVELGPAEARHGAMTQRRRFRPAETRRLEVDLYAGDDEVTRVDESDCAIEVVVRSEPIRVPLTRGVPEP
ncbi:MAG: hypothetical protein JRH16_11635 [Deltaproteobacteria bacterium]|nr:hypothetical protein [Deltaproteobacteria bacterium]MBW2362268.1 hypothetical protein [Deltaproteobacteria bacterium]